MTRLSAILPALMAPLLLASCFPRPDYRDLPDARVIRHTSAEVVRLTVADTAAATPEERAAVTEALVRAGERGLRVRVLLPQGAPVPVTEEMRRRVTALGLDPAIVRVEPDASAGGTTLVFVRIEAVAPDCAQLVTPSETLPIHDRPQMSFGCATYTNLGAMVTDPADLAVPRAYGGADGTTSAAAVRRYRDDDVTSLRGTTSVGGMAGSSGGGGH